MDLLLSWLQQGLASIGPFIVLLGLLIFVHELGHFLVAKFYGVRVEVFSLGFGKKIFQHQKGDTNYCISMIPLGGYVKMFGDDPTSEVPEDQQKYAFLKKPVGQRIAIVLAGPLMNLFFAFVLFVAVALIGEQVPAPVVGDVAEETSAYQAGFRAGDEIVKIAGQEVDTWNDVDKIIKTNPGEELTFTIKREETGEVTQLTATPQLKPNENILSTEREVGKIEGLEIQALAPVVGVPNPDSLAAQAGLKPLDLILSVDGTEVSYWRNLAPTLKKELQDGTAQLTVKTYMPGEDTKERQVQVALPEGSQVQEDILSQLGLEGSELYLAKIRSGTPAEGAGLKAGDKIVQVNGEPVTEWMQVLKTVKAFNPASDSMDFVINRKGESLDLSIKPEMTEQMTRQGQEEERFMIGIYSGVAHTLAPPVLVRTTNPVEAVHRGFDKTVKWTRMVVMGLVRLVQGEVSTKTIGGVITIGRLSSQSFEVGLSAFFSMMATISINLFLLNLLPVPILDGGHLVFFSIEALRGAPLSLKKMEMAQQVGLVILMSLMAFALFNDITNWLNSTW